MVELLTVIAIAGMFAAIAVPSASRAAGNVSAGVGARRLALMLRVAQALAQSRAAEIVVTVSDGGDVVAATADGTRVLTGALGTSVSSTYAGGRLVFTQAGWATLPGGSSPRAGHFTVGSGASAHTVTIQLAGCVRCT